MHNNKVLKRTHLFNKNKTSMYICDHSTSEYLGFYTAIKLKSIFAKTVFINWFENMSEDEIELGIRSFQLG